MANLDMAVVANFQQWPGGKLLVLSGGIHFRSVVLISSQLSYSLFSEIEKISLFRGE
jgi:hypothetical protein